MTIAYALQLSHAKKGHLKLITDKGTKKQLIKNGKKRHCPKDCFYWIGVYRNGVLRNSENI